MDGNRLRMKSNTLLSKVVGILVVGLLSFVSNEIKFVNDASTYFDEDTIARHEVGEEKVEKNNPNQATTLTDMPRINTIQSSHHNDQHGYHESHILQMMEDEGSALELSRIQQASFEKRRDLLPSIMPRARRYPAFLSDWGANIVNEEYAYIHIFKNGGTTIAAQTKRDHVKIQDFKFNDENGLHSSEIRLNISYPDGPSVATEVASGLLRTGLLDKGYDERVLGWLRRVQMFSRRQNSMPCEVHSVPQVNMFLNYRGFIPTNLEIIGDLKELPSVLKLVGFEYKPSVVARRNATENDFKETHFPKRPDLLSTETMRRLCDFLAIDYYLLDYPLPTPCADMPPSGYTVVKYRPPPPVQFVQGGTNPQYRSFNNAALERRVNKHLADKLRRLDKEGMTS